MRFLLVMALLLLPLQASASVIVDLNKADASHLAELQTGVDDDLIQAIFGLSGQSRSLPQAGRPPQGARMDEENFQQLFPFEMNGSIVIEVDEPKGISPY